MLFHCKCQLNHLSEDSNTVSLFVNWLGLSNPNSNLMMRRAGLSISAAKIKGFMIMEWHFLHRWHSVKVSQQSLSRLVDHPYLWRFTPEWWYHNGWFYEFTMLLMMNIWLSCQMLIVIIEMLLFLLWGLWRWENPGEARGRNLQLFCKLQMQLLGNFLQPSHGGDAILSS